MKNTLFVFCEGSAIDKKSGQWSIFGHIENMKVTAPENENVTVKGKFNLVSFWTREQIGKSEDLTIKYQFADEKGEVLMNSEEFKFDIKENISTFKHRASLNKVPFKREGMYYFQVLQEKEGEFESAARIPIKLKVELK